MPDQKKTADSHEYFHTRFHSVNKYHQELDNSERDDWQMPERVIDSLQLSKNVHIVDIGMGTGYFVLRIAEQLSDATVLGLDVEPKMIAAVQQQAQQRKLHNVTAQLVTTGKIVPFLKPVDRILCVNTYHHIPNSTSYFAQCIPQLQPEGTIAIIDFTLTAEMGPPKKHRVSATQVIAEMKNAGYTLQKKIDYLPYQYFLLFTSAEKR